MKTLPLLTICASFARILLHAETSLPPAPVQTIARTPTEIVKAAYNAANEGRYQEALGYMSVDYKRSILGQGLKKNCDYNTRNRTIASVEPVDESIKGFKAIVTVKVVFKDGRSKEDRTVLLQEASGWRINGPEREIR